MTRVWKMTEPVAPPAQPAPRRRITRWGTLIAASAGAGLIALWAVDPRELAWPMCSFHTMTGWHCPGCGGLRATHDLLHGRLLWALRDNAFWVLSLPLLLYAAGSQLRRTLRGRPLPGDLASKPWFYVTIAVLGVVFAVLRNIPADPFTSLVPP